VPMHSRVEGFQILTVMSKDPVTWENFEGSESLETNQTAKCRARGAHGSKSSVNCQDSVVGNNRLDVVRRRRKESWAKGGSITRFNRLHY
jgi:hypothetical protein